jgi:hypothetical protein
MFIIERRTAGVLVALATAAAIVVLGSIRDPLDVAETPTTADSTPALATSVGSDARADRLAQRDR